MRSRPHYLPKPPAKKKGFRIRKPGEEVRPPVPNVIAFRQAPPLPLRQSTSMDEIQSKKSDMMRHGGSETGLVSIQNLSPAPLKRNS